MLPKEKKVEFTEHLEDIFPVDLFAQSASADLEEIDRQLRCLSIRLDRYSANPAKDAQKQAKIRPYLDRLKEFQKKQEELGEEGLDMMDRYRRMIDDFRVSLFAPELKTRQKVSTKKLDQLWHETFSKW